MRHLIAVIVTAIVFGACRAGVEAPGTDGSPSGSLPAIAPSEVSSTRSPRPTASARTSSALSAVAAASPSSVAAEVEASDSFWDQLVGGESMLTYESLDAIVADSHLIVVGRATNVREGESYSVGGLRFMYATVALDDILSGVPETTEPGTIELRMDYPATTEVSDLAESIPDHQTLFFLMNGGELSNEKGHLPDEQERWRYVYIPAGPGGVLRDIGGQAYGMGLDDPADFPNDLAGEPFAEVVEDVRVAIGDG